MVHRRARVVGGAWDYLDEDLLLAGAELIWRAGARRLERARRFAVHALAQAERIAAANGRRCYSLFNGDVGSALFAAACLDAILASRSSTSSSQPPTPRPACGDLQAASAHSFELTRRGD